MQWDSLSFLLASDLPCRSQFSGVGNWYVERIAFGFHDLSTPTTLTDTIVRYG
ncbi:hypothetical protein ACPOL_7142 (plasmid) [Acidisarcina polymorpha]|uniref:Uncharacterized protein n=1 Tax=Acidisarcina polymorpha TaxID=2211140 RepID=A0A2Z5GBN1_9BACT|nr:hypothetical protein ACPOL_6918 [Acidisarcina polymorpha]AXC16334.1 hypothetical protein ACPOL_7142 [Acidisarcina polymorpha]